MSYTQSNSEINCEWPDNTICYSQEESSLTPAEPWENVGQPARSTVEKLYTPSLRDTPGDLKPPNPKSSICLRSSTGGEPPRTSAEAHESNCDLPQRRLEPAPPSSRSDDLNREIEVASIHAQQVLDDYLESHIHVHSLVEALFAGLYDRLLISETRTPTSEGQFESLVDAQTTLLSRSAAVKESKLKLERLRIALQAQHKGEWLKSSHCQDIETDIDHNEEIPPVVAEYFEAAGAADVENERLADLESDYEEHLLARKRHGSTDEALCESDSELDGEYLRKRQELAATLAILHYRLHARKDACLVQGFDPERYRYRRLSSVQR